MMQSKNIEELLLIRFWRAGEKGMTEHAIYKEISSLSPVALSAEMVKGSCDGLAKAGLLTNEVAKKQNKYCIAPAGAERVRSMVPSTTGLPWKELFVRYCLGLSGPKKLKQHAIRVALLRELCTIPEGATLAKAVDRFLLQHLQQPNARDVKQGVMRRALSLSPQPIDLGNFSEAVAATARRTPSGWVGNKVFVSHVWKSLQDAGNFRGMTLNGFKDLLVRANQEGLLSLSRADLAPLFNQQDVRESQIEYMDATFHFLIVDRQEA